MINLFYQCLEKYNSHGILTAIERCEPNEKKGIVEMSQQYLDRGSKGKEFALSFVLIFIVTLLSLPCTLAEYSPLEDSMETEIEYAPGEILVKFQPTVSKAEVEEIVKGYGLQILEIINGLGIYRLSISHDKKMEEWLSLLNEDPKILYAEPNYLYQTEEETGNLEGQLPYQVLELRSAWELLEKAGGSSDIAVAVIDTGVEYTSLIAGFYMDQCWRGY